MKEEEDPVDLIFKDASMCSRYVIFMFLSLGFLAAYSGCVFTYVFLARDIKYRCLIQECEPSPTETIYEPKWLKRFVPYKGSSPDSCHRYAPRNNSCSTEDTSGNETLRCDKFVYQTKDVTLVHDFNLHCDENTWKLTMVGTISMIGELVCLAYTGFISDKYGRKTILIICAILSTIVGVIKSFSISYQMYVFLEFLDSVFGGAIYYGPFILAMEFVAPRNRNLVNIVICSLYAIGGCYLGIIAWLFPYWRTMLRVLYFPRFICIVFFWTVPESIRWLLSKNKISSIHNIVSKVKGLKNKEDPNLTKLLNTYYEVQTQLCSENTKVSSEKFIDAIKHKSLLLRFLICCFIWVTVNFIYYGLTLNSVDLTDDIYLSFIVSCLVEIPGYIVYYVINEKIGRRLLTSVTFILAGLACLAVGFIPQDIQWLRLTLYLIGKCSSTVTYTVIFIYTTEMFPTTCRHSMLSICGMMGRLGSLISPQIPLLARVSEMLPLVLFAIMGSISGTLALLFPETLNTKLPQTIQEAINIGKRDKRNARRDSAPPES
ncbi:solute carrier family 22 member 3-like [Diabrotica undecimpunctata]|uniref:solute carrier family 22 member 3-like n=1 Tax=Diabrotica undecimpunctata TaxID=50387 RepID=UPI003B641931